MIQSTTVVIRILKQCKMETCWASSTPFPSFIARDKSMDSASKIEKDEISVVHYGELVGS